MAGVKREGRVRKLQGQPLVLDNIKTIEDTGTVRVKALCGPDTHPREMLKPAGSRRISSQLKKEVIVRQKGLENSNTAVFCLLRTFNISIDLFLCDIYFTVMLVLFNVMYSTYMYLNLMCLSFPF